MRRTFGGVCVISDLGIRVKSEHIRSVCERQVFDRAHVKIFRDVHLNRIFTFQRLAWKVNESDSLIHKMNKREGFPLGNRKDSQNGRQFARW